jgi:hypothetical protein
LFGISDYFNQVNQQFSETNAAIPGIAAPPGLSIITGGATADAMGVPSLMQAAAESWEAGTVSGSFYFAGYAAAANYVASGITFESGLYLGTMGYVIYNDLVYGPPIQNSKTCP